MSSKRTRTRTRRGCKVASTRPRETLSVVSSHLITTCQLAHKSVESNAWNISTVKGQREREIELLEDVKARVQGLVPVFGSQKVSWVGADKVIVGSARTSLVHR